MSNEIKKKHHYVWREYLRNWSKNDKINALKLDERKTLNGVNLINVAQENFFYKFQEFTLEEEIILLELIKESSDVETLKFNLEIYRTFTLYSKVKTLVDDYLKLKPTNQVAIEYKLNLIKFNGIENIHTLLENFGKKIINVKNIHDLKFLEDSDELFFTVYFMCFQYLRTKKMRKSVLEVIEMKNYLSIKYLDIISFIFATGLANGLCFYKDIKFNLLHNNSSHKFITSDQPLVNLKRDIKDEENRVKEFELYYPLNPTLALVLHYDNSSQAEKFKAEEIDEFEVQKLNKFIMKNSDNYIFANNIEQLEFYKNYL